MVDSSIKINLKRVNLQARYVPVQNGVSIEF